MKHLEEVSNVIYKIFRRKKKQTLCGLLFSERCEGESITKHFLLQFTALLSF